MNKGKYVTKRNGMKWYNCLSENEKQEAFKFISYAICKSLYEGNSINLSKALVRNKYNFGFDLMDFIVKHSVEVSNCRSLLNLRM